MTGRAPFQFSDFPRLEGEDINAYMARYFQRTPSRRAESVLILKPPPENVRLPYAEPREPGEEG